MARLKKILVVDDDADIRNHLFDVLSDEGFKVTVAKDGRESLKQMKTRRFDLLITDMHMPHMDGIELLKRMKKAVWLPSVSAMFFACMSQPNSFLSRLQTACMNS